jgi:hypothetical protein
MYYSDLVTSVQDTIENTFPTLDMNRFIEQVEQRIYNTVQLPSLRKNVTGNITSGNQYLAAPNDFLSVYSLAIYPATGYPATPGATNSYLYLLNKDVNFIREAYPNTAVTGQPKHYAIFGPQSGNEAELTFILGPTPNMAYTAELHYYYYPASIIQAALSSVSIYNAGTGYTNGTYYNVSLTGGTGNSATANIVVSGGVVTSVSLVNNGCYYAVGDLLSATLGSTGTNFQIQVTTISNPNGETWVGDNFDTALMNGVLVEAARYIKAEADTVNFYKEMYTQSIALLKNLGDGKLRMDAYRDGQLRLPVV